MRQYSAEAEHAIRVRRLIDEWKQSGLIDAAQHAQMVPELQVGLRRTNLFLRLTLFVFGLLIAAASVGLIAVALDVDSQTGGGVLCLTAAAAFVMAAELLAGPVRVYRFGVEEACATGSVLLCAMGTALITGGWSWNGPSDVQAFVGLIAGSAAASAVYRRFGYVYAAVGAMLCAALAAFQLPVPAVTQRLVAVAIAGACAIPARRKRLRYRDEFPGDEYGIIHASAWAAVYAILNLHLNLDPLFQTRSSDVPAAFYWATYVIVWILPAVCVRLAIRDRDRPLLDASLVLAVLTLVTNKPYLGMARKPWDPILFGALLITAAVFVRRWLAAGAGGARAGITATQLLRSDMRSTTVVSTVSGAFHPALTHQHSGPPANDPFKGEGGRSGGAGGGATF